MRNEHAIVAEQFDDPVQEYQAATLGMWVFLGTEILFFGVLFAGYAVSRFNYPEAFAEASRHTDVVFGTISTGVLLTSGLSMALAVRGAKLGRDKAILGFLILTILLAITFLFIEGTEYYHAYKEQLIPAFNFTYESPHEKPVELFFFLYFLMTGMHAVHVTIGILIMIAIAIMAGRGRFSSYYYTPVELTGLYWAFVDIVWVFIYPLFYLVSRA
ncbi:cytochrome c oxidase subunit 3 [Nitrosococcus watsonii]|uniref:Cytochrome c oxidase subunit III n=1 Tax=Nitrosococcus watsoni (strain C-113) TaxID=105559 RepID=D8K591_NITWC|nr:cytochrome c oxidase subunit 3 [Nitrosococcus watsonii]ADJ28068.1 cytochrome c oxidase subunit III [Nitrosococcus watsonii C-113]